LHNDDWVTYIICLGPSGYPYTHRYGDEFLPNREFI
jgi:hypothetical protein